MGRDDKYLERRTCRHQGTTKRIQAYAFKVSNLSWRILYQAVEQWLILSQQGGETYNY